MPLRYMGSSGQPKGHHNRQWYIIYFMRGQVPEDTIPVPLKARVLASTTAPAELALLHLGLLLFWGSSWEFTGWKYLKQDQRKSLLDNMAVSYCCALQMQMVCKPAARFAR